MTDDQRFHRIWSMHVPEFMGCKHVGELPDSEKRSETEVGTPAWRQALRQVPDFPSSLHREREQPSMLT
jgi:hypothetical protein